VSPSAGLNGCGKSRPPLGFDPRAVQPVANRYTNYAVGLRMSGNTPWSLEPNNGTLSSTRSCLLAPPVF